MPAYLCHQEVEQGHPWLLSKFEANLELLRPCFVCLFACFLNLKIKRRECHVLQAPWEPCPLLNRKRGGVEWGKGGREEVVGGTRGRGGRGNCSQDVKHILRKGWDRMKNHLKSLLFQFSLPISHPTTRQIFERK